MMENSYRSTIFCNRGVNHGQGITTGLAVFHVRLITYLYPLLDNTDSYSTSLAIALSNLENGSNQNPSESTISLFPHVFVL
jgi:hypothetical protein